MVPYEYKDTSRVSEVFQGTVYGTLRDGAAVVFVAILRRTIHQLRVQQGPVDRESALFGVRVLRVGTVLCL